MNKRGVLSVFLVLASGTFSAFAEKKPDTSHLAFVKEFVRELGAVEEIRDKGEQDLKEDPKAIFSNMIHSATLFKLELGSQIRMLSGMNLTEPFKTLIPSITGFYEEKIKLWQRMGEIGSYFTGSGPKAGIDYDKVAAEMPELRARLEYIDQALFQATPVVFSTLIDMKADSQHHANHLMITKAERADLIDYINTAFGKKIGMKNPNYTVGAARVLRDGLLKDFKCSDER
jgi:hypothetical protein